jgi:ribA/ribD-fused uncharacterized protein
VEGDINGPIYFYSKSNQFYEFSNFSPYGFEIDSLFWPTVEHYFQAQKFPEHPVYQAEIRRARSCKHAKELGRSKAVPLRPDWEVVRDDVMRRALLAKFRTHRLIRDLLVATDERELIENAPSDYYWGCGATGTGKNRLGVLLMELRSELRDA